MRCCAGIDVPAGQSDLSRALRMAAPAAVTAAPSGLCVAGCCSSWLL